MIIEIVVEKLPESDSNPDGVAIEIKFSKSENFNDEEIIAILQQTTIISALSSGYDIRGLVRIIDSTTIGAGENFKA